MIMVLKRSNIVFIAAIFILSLALIGINNIFMATQTEAPGVHQSPEQDSNRVAGTIGKGKTVIVDAGH